MYFLKTNIYILTSIDGANDVNAADACMAQPFYQLRQLVTTATTSGDVTA